MTWRRVVSLAFLLVAIAPAPDAWASPAGAEHLPDLQTLKPSDLTIDTANGQKLLRFSNTVVNLGNGRLELRPETPKASLFTLLSPPPTTTRAYQAIYTHTSSGHWYKAREQYVGTFKFHPEHDHWHFEKFARYELYTVAPDGSLGQPLNRLGEKTTFCLVDSDQVNPNLTHSGPQTYTKCGQASVSGITVGWGDKYAYDLDGQHVDISGLRDGTYWLVSTVDDLNRLAETNDENNSAQVRVRIVGNSVTVEG